MTEYLELEDYLPIAERVLGLPVEAIANFDRIGLAESALAAPQAGFGGVEAYADFETKAAVLCWHPVKSHPLPDGNRRCAFKSMWWAEIRELVQQIGVRAHPVAGDPTHGHR